MLAYREPIMHTSPGRLRGQETRLQALPVPNTLALLAGQALAHLEQPSGTPRGLIGAFLVSIEVCQLVATVPMNGEKGNPSETRLNADTTWLAVTKIA